MEKIQKMDDNTYKHNPQQFCPLCKKNVYFIPRYPNYVCADCIDTGTFTDDGKKISFSNVDYTGGFMSIIDGVKGTEHVCYIKGVKCRADESRFGGIVIQTSK